MYDIEEVFEQVISMGGSLDMVERDFKRMLEDDVKLRRAYRNWCEEHGYSEKHGFMEYCSERMDAQQSSYEIFDTDN